MKSQKPIYRHCSCGRTKWHQKNRITIIAMRHGESEHNVLNIVNGDPKKQFHITRKGRLQAKALALKLRNREISAIIVSQMQRTKDTAAPLARFKKLRIQVDKRLNDIRAGKLEGININQFRKLTGNVHKSVKGSENGKHVALRLRSFLKDVMKYYSGKTIAVVSSEVVLHSLKQIAAGEFSDENVGKHIQNAKVYEFHLHSPICCLSCGDFCEI